MHDNQKKYTNQIIRTIFLNSIKNKEEKEEIDTKGKDIKVIISHS